VLTVRDGRIAEVFAFRATEIFGRFGLPHELASQSERLTHPSGTTRR
jgi:hypothetical protein